MTQAQKRALVLILILPVLTFSAFSREPSPFASRELSVMPSPASASELNLPAGSSVVDYDLWPTGPDAVILIHDSAGSHVVSWYVGDSSTVPLLDLPASFTATSIAVHPIEHRFFIGGKTGQQSRILVADNTNGNWAQRTIYQSSHELRRLLVAPRPFEIGWNEEQKQPIESYRLFFAERQPNGAFSTRSTTEEGKREYQVIGPETSYIKLPEEDEGPTPNFVSSALPAAFHPDGHLLIWQDGNGCFQQLAYAGKNWDKPSHLAGNPCGGSLTVTPNGAALLHWKRGVSGVAVIADHGRTSSVQADNYQFMSTPSSTPDGRGIIGLVGRPGGQEIVYVPIGVPLADVINAWMFIEDAADRDRFTASAGLFRATGEDQMYELYDTEAYACGGYDYDRRSENRPQNAA